MKKISYYRNAIRSVQFLVVRLYVQHNLSFPRELFVVYFAVLAVIRSAIPAVD